MGEHKTRGLLFLATSVSLSALFLCLPFISWLNLMISDRVIIQPFKFSWGTKKVKNFTADSLMTLIGIKELVEKRIIGRAQ